MRNLKITAIAVFCVFLSCFSIYSDASEAEIPLYIREHLKDIEKYYIANNFVFTVNEQFLIILFGEFKDIDKNNKEKKDYDSLLTHPFALVIFDGVLQEEKNLEDILRSRIEALEFGYTENIKNIYLYGREISVSWSRKTNLIKAEIKCVCGCAVGVFSKEICYHKDCPMTGRR